METEQEINQINELKKQRKKLKRKINKLESKKEIPQNIENENILIYICLFSFISLMSIFGYFYLMNYMVKLNIKKYYELCRLTVFVLFCFFQSSELIYFGNKDNIKNKLIFFILEFHWVTFLINFAEYIYKSYNLTIIHIIVYSLIPKVLVLVFSFYFSKKNNLLNHYYKNVH